MGMDGVSSGRYHGWDMDALREWIEFVGTSSCLPQGCSAGMDGVCGNEIMVATWMLCGNGWSLLWTLSWLGHGCSVGMDRVCGNVIMVGTWMLCGNGWSLWERYHGCHMDAGMDGVCGNVIMVATWMLCGNGWSLLWTLSWLGHGCSAGMDRVCGNVIMVATWMLCGNGRSLWERYQGCHMDALREWMEFVGTSSWLPHGCSVGMDRVCWNVIMVATWMLCGNG